MGIANLGFSFSHVHCNKSLLSLLLLNVIGDAGVVEVLLPLVCFVVSMLDQNLLSTFLVIIAKLAISFYISLYSWDLTNLLLMCVQAMKQGTIEGSRVFFLISSLHIVFEFLGCKFSLVASAHICKWSFVSNFSIPSIASW
jgi:hypothetical protein